MNGILRSLRARGPRRFGASSVVRAAFGAWLAVALVQCSKLDDRQLELAAGTNSAGASGSSNGGGMTSLGGSGAGQAAGEGGQPEPGTGGTSGVGGNAFGGNAGSGEIEPCAEGQRECAGECLDEGQCCDAEECPDGESCVSGACACNEGTVRCGSACIPEGNCCADEDCPEGASCSSGACECPDGSHQCGEVCAADDSVETCGTSCEPCLAPTGGSAECVEGRCRATCPSSQRPCAGTCIPNSMACTGSCTTGTHDCSGVCNPDTDVTACGTRCTPCPTPANGTATCDGTNCGFTCAANYKPCGSTCIPSSACCTSAECGANRTCTASRECQCATGYKACGSACISVNTCCTNQDCGANGTCSTSNVCSCLPNYFGPGCAVYFSGLGYPLTSHSWGEATAVSEDGTTVVGASRSTGGFPEAFRWQNGSFLRLGLVQGGTESRAFAVSANGSVVVGDAQVQDGSLYTWVAFRWVNGTMAALPLPEFGSFSHARGVSGDGNIVVGYGDNDNERRAIRWVNAGVGTVSSIDPLYFMGISTNGQAIGGYMAGPNPPGIPITYRSGTTQLNGLTNFPGGAVLALSTTGTVAAGYVRSGTAERAARWTGTTASDLGVLPGESSRALAINGSGDIVVGVSGTQAFIWTANSGIRPLTTLMTEVGVDLTNWQIQSATGISGDGRTIVGNGMHGVLSEPWILRLP